MVAGVPIPKEVLAMDLRPVSEGCGGASTDCWDWIFSGGTSSRINYENGRSASWSQASWETAPGEKLALAARNDAPLREGLRSMAKTEWMRVEYGMRSPLQWVIAGRKAKRLGVASIGVNSGANRCTSTEVRIGSAHFSKVVTGIHDRQFFAGEGGLLGNGLCPNSPSRSMPREGRIHWRGAECEIPCPDHLGVPFAVFQPFSPHSSELRCPSRLPFSARDRSERELRDALREAAKERANYCGLRCSNRPRCCTGSLRCNTVRGEISREEFRAFVRGALARQPELQALAWDPRVPDAERATAEELARDEGFPGFSFSERGGEQDLIVAAAAQSISPCIFLERSRETRMRSASMSHRNRTAGALSKSLAIQGRPRLRRRCGWSRKRKGNVAFLSSSQSIAAIP